MTLPKAIIIASIIISSCFILFVNEARYEVIPLVGGSVIKVNKVTGDFAMCSPSGLEPNTTNIYTYACGSTPPTSVK